MDLKINKNCKSGFSLIEVLVVMFIAAVVFTSFYTVSMVGTRYIIEAKNRLAAVAVANERMEIVRNLSYENVGILEGIDISGNLDPDEYKTVNGRTYHITTTVRYFDDPMDGTVSSSPVDSIPNDYKLVRVVVSWNDTTGLAQSVSASSRFVPPGLETNVGGSPLSINVSSKNNGVETPVDGASVSMTNTSPVVNDIIATDGDGHIMLPAASVASNYHLVITKNGYERVETMDSTPTFIPMYKHVDVIANNLNQYSFEQNMLANLHIKAADYQNNPVGGIGFSIAGGKIIGHDELNNVIYRMSNTAGNGVFGLASTTGTTDIANGEKEYSAISPGDYTVVMNANTDYEFIDFDPAISPAVLAAGSDSTYAIRVADKSVRGIFLKLRDIVDGAPVADAQITLTDNSDNEVFSGKRSSLRGVFFYPDGVEPLAAGAYNLKIEAAGYVTKTEPIDINSGLLDLPINLDRS